MKSIKQNFSQLLFGLGTVALVAMFTGASANAESRLSTIVKDKYPQSNSHSRRDDHRGDRRDNRHNDRSSSSDNHRDSRHDDPSPNTTAR